MSSKPRSSGPRSGRAPSAGAAAAPAASAAGGAAAVKKDSRSPSPSGGAAAPAGDETRLLVDWHHVGAIIGKGGASVRQVREESGCAINIIAPAPNAPSPQQTDRIMTIRGTVAATTKAIFLIAHTIQARAAERKAAGQESEPRAAGRGAKGELPDGQAAIRLLVHRAAVGAVIGKAGAAIRDTQAETGARIQVSSEPLGGSTDKTVTISGTPEVVQLAVGRVLTQLAQSPLRAGTKTVHYVPGPAFYDYADGQQQQQQQHVQQHHAHPQQAVGSGAGVVTGAGPISIQKIAIPTICAGCVIGRSGSIIRDLRSQSGTNISIADPDPATPDERVVTITGSPSGIQAAVYLIRQCVESYVPPSHAGGDDGAEQQHEEQPQQQQGQQQEQQQQQTTQQ